MDHESNSDFVTPQPTEPEGSLEMEAKPTLDSLPEALGFNETAELGQLRAELIEAIVANAENLKELATQYHLLAEEIVNKHQGDDFAKAQIGLIVQMGLIKRDGGRVFDYQEDLQDAFTYADNMGFVDILPPLQEVLDALSGPDNPENQT